MPTPPIPAEEIARRVKAYDEAVAKGYAPIGTASRKGQIGAVQAAALALGVDQHCIRLALKPRNAAPEQLEPVSRIEKLDATFWRKKFEAADEELTSREAELRAVTGLLERPAEPPEWVVERRTGPLSRSLGLLHVSDTHVGEVVDPNEVNGVNEYSPDVFVRRIRRLFSAAIEIMPRWSADGKLVGFVVAVNGDLVSGDIHDELRRTNALTAMEQAYLCADELTAGLEHLKRLGPVWAVFTPGNHGRTTEKTHSKRTSRLSYDMLVGEMVRRHFAGSDVEVSLALGRDIEYPLFSFNVFQSHGDALGTGGGKGFAGPVLPIARGGRNVDLQAYAMDHRHHIKLTAHYHTSANPGRGHFANGSMIGFNEFAMGIRAVAEPPQQWLLHVHERWGVRERCEIRLEGAAIEKPRVRVPVGFSA
jgi:hypothetical protein